MNAASRPDNQLLWAKLTSRSSKSCKISTRTDKKNRKRSRMQELILPRRYQLTDRGRSALRAAVQKNEPWKRSTGPRTPAGKSRSARNSLKHGLRSSNERKMDKGARELWIACAVLEPLRLATYKSPSATYTRLTRESFTTKARTSSPGSLSPCAKTDAR